MPNYTTNYNLKKPLQTENYNVDDFNGNADIIDTALKNIDDTKVDVEVGKGLSDENYTLIEKNKLADIEENATADMTALEIKTEYESNADTNAYTDAEKAKVANLPDDTIAQLAEKAAKTDIGLLSGLLTTAKTSIVNAINELFNSKANKAQEAWITPTLVNGWVETDASRAPKYMKDQFGVVHLKGCVKSGLLANTIFFLPAGYRPENTFNAFPVISNGVLGNCLVQSAGAVQASSGSNVNFYLDGISFKGV